jgi:MYXO-CTERM domain-containing protein
VLNYLSRTVSYYDVSGLLGGTSNAVVELATVPTASREVLDAVVLRGKQIFHDAADDRMSRDGYISCSSCHLDGGHDGRTWDFTQAGEGLRNTIALAGRAGTGHGRVHWTANFDELQDFENDIRLAFGGTGFLSDADFMATRDPLGPNKAGRSPELDALAVYVASLSDYPPSPHRAPDGALTEAARRGRVVFGTAGCVTCHAGATFTDGQRHDVGTISPGSGLGLGRALAGVGFDTPTLRSLWAGAPYLHDGSAADLDEALLRHGGVPVLEAAARADLVAYLLELDGTSLPPEAPCAQGPDECVGGSVVPPDAGATEDAAQSGADAATDAAVVAVDGAVSADAGVGTPDAGVVPPADAGCGCSATTAPASTSAGLWLGALALLVLARRRRR